MPKKLTKILARLPCFENSTMDFVKCILFLVTFVQITSGKLTRVYENSTFLDKGNNSAVKLSWKYEPNQDVLYMALEVKATGWVGFGFANRIFDMQGYDVIIGKVENGKGTMTDRHTVGYMEPLADLQQDYNMTYYEEVNGTTTLEFHRKRLTGDSKDLDIKLGPMLLVYAYHSTADYPSPYKTKHDHQGYKTVELLPLNTKIPQNTTSSIVLKATTIIPAVMSTGRPVMKSSSVAMSTSILSTLIPLTSSVYTMRPPATTSTALSPQATSVIEEREPTSTVAMSTHELPATIPLTSSISTSISSNIMKATMSVKATTSEPAPTSLVMLPTITTSASVSSSSMTSSLTSSLRPSLSSLSLVSSVYDPFVVPPDIYDRYIKVSLRAKITNVQYEVIEDRKKPDYLKFKRELEKHLEERKNIWKAIVTDIRKGSVIVDYDIYVNTTSSQETRQVIDDIQQDVKNGRLGIYHVDPRYPMNSVLTMKVPSGVEPSSSSVKSNDSGYNLVLIIIMSCAVGLVFIMLIVIIVLVICVRKWSQKSSSYSLKPMETYKYEVKY